MIVPILDLVDAIIMVKVLLSIGSSLFGGLGRSSISHVDAITEQTLFQENQCGSNSQVCNNVGNNLAYIGSIIGVMEKKEVARFYNRYKNIKY